MFEKLEEQIRKQYEEQIKQVENAEKKDVLQLKEIWSYRKYKTKNGIIKAMTRNITNTYLLEPLAELNAVREAKDFGTQLIVSIEWKSSRTWGSNPRASTNFGFEGESIGGCGFCKQSTALAQGLNSHLPLLKLLFAKKERGLKEGITDDKMRNYLGYGSGYQILPHFEGGVGVESHRNIIEGLNLTFEHVSGKSFDVFTIRGV